MNCIFICVFNNENYIKMLYLLLESIYIHIHNNINNNFKILLYTNTEFMRKITKSNWFSDYIDFEINDNYNSIDSACKARLDLFTLPTIQKYKKILYLDTDILINGDIHRIFDLVKEDILYVLEEGTIYDNSDFWGKSLFGNEINKYADKTAFTSGILLFNNCKRIKDLFHTIKIHFKRNNNNGFHDQPYFVYNAFKFKLYNNKMLKTYAVNNDINIQSNKTIHHFPGGPGIYINKIIQMESFLKELKNYKTNTIMQVIKKYITRHLSHEYLIDIMKKNEKNSSYENKNKNIINILLNKNIKNIV